MKFILRTHRPIVCLGIWLVFCGIGQAGQQDVTLQKGIKIDGAVMDTPDWQRMIELAKQSLPLRAGHGQMTLMRVILKKADRKDLLQLTSTKLVLPGKSGGGMYQQIRSGDFVLIEHINSSRRQDGRDPVEIGSLGHHRATVWVDVPPRGTLGVLGDVVLSPVPKKNTGRIAVTVRGKAREPLKITNFRFGPIVVGGSYGETIPFDSDGVCDTGRIAPGEYKVLLPDFDVVKSRWTVKVLPGRVTRLNFVARSQQQVSLVGDTSEAISESSPKKRLKANRGNQESMKQQH